MMSARTPIARNIRPEPDGSWTWELSAERAATVIAPQADSSNVECIQPRLLHSGLLGYPFVTGQVSIAEAVMGNGSSRSELVNAFSVAANDILTWPGVPSTTVGADALEKSELLIQERLAAADPRLAIVVEATRKARALEVGDKTEAPAIGLGRFVLPEREGAPSLLLHPGTPAPPPAQLGRWVEELGLTCLLFREKSPEIAVRAQFLVRTLDDWTSVQPDRVTLNALLALGAHIYRRLHGPPAPPEAVTAMFDFAEALIDRPADIGLPWRSST